MSSSSVLLIVAVAATLCYVATAQVCQGANMTLNVNSYSPAGTRCPYGYVSYASEGRCLTYRQLVNNFLYAPCNIDSDCGPLATNPSHVATSGQFMICGTQKVCTWARSRALGDECTVNANCFGNYNTPFPAPSALEPAIYGCAKKNNTCVRATYVYTAGLNERCNYQDRDEYIRCDPTKFICSDINSGSCRARREIGQACGAAYTPCVLTAYCNSTSNVCDAQRARGEECNAAIFDQCSQAAGVTRCIQNVCSPLRNLNEVCTTSGDCSTAVDINAFCFAGLCTVPASLGQRCNETFSCQPNLKCVTVDATTTPNVRVCVNYAGNNETCGSGQFDNICANNFTCVRGRCSANGNGDPCTFSGTGIAEFGNCNSGLVCINKDVCVPRVSVGGNCSTTDLLCLDNLYCTNFNVGASVSLNRTCVAYQQRGQPCDPGLSPNPALNPLNPLRCNTTLNCARGVCIEKYTLSEGAFCAQSTDCDTGFCDPMFKQCSRRKMCSTSGTVNLGGESYQCDCICSSGSENLGRCVLDLCDRQKQELTDCMNFNFRVNFQKSYLTPTFAFLDSQSSFYKKCEYQHQQYVNCQGYMSKLSAPAVALGDAINYNLAGINSANTMSTSLMVVVAAVVSLLLML